jgi:fatty-acyl-CoA synthase
MQIIDYLDLGARRSLHNPCIVNVDGSGSWTFAEAQDYTHRVAAALNRDGFLPGERVTVLSPNRGDAYLTLLGGLRAQLLWFPVNPRYTIDSIIGLLAQFHCDMLFPRRRVPATCHDDPRRCADDPHDRLARRGIE